MRRFNALCLAALSAFSEGQFSTHPNPDQFDIGSGGAEWSIFFLKSLFFIHVDGLTLSDYKIKSSVLMSIQNLIYNFVL